MIVFDKVSKVFHLGSGAEEGLSVLENVDLTVAKGESCVVLGRSGVGKSVLLKSLLGLLPLTSGDIVVDGISVRDRRQREAYRRKFGMLFQGGALFDSMTILENVSFALIERGIPHKSAFATAREKLFAVDLEERTHSLYPSSLSGGMQKRAALSRAIALEPDILLFDEPTTGLDPLTGATITHLLRQILETSGLTALTITHDLAVVRVLADQVCMLDEGNIVWKGAVSDFEKSPYPLVKSFLKAASGNSVS